MTLDAQRGLGPSQRALRQSGASGLGYDLRAGNRSFGKDGEQELLRLIYGQALLAGRRGGKQSVGVMSARSIPNNMRGLAV